MVRLMARTAERGPCMLPQPSCMHWPEALCTACLQFTLSLCRTAPQP
jgi:hypothetical protein